ncbi:Protein of uncharacterised function (DUF3264) [Enterocloster clostridioformis]|uniref:Protein of uncharacterized function (DUF3264) n=1 Tax=Enterocloster clostridioformis TaxID=1531 RepID=A0A2X2VRE4_9FIRM|nr:Protein of uncharacterised function (DUF3264) [Enterocloster clostridioformis]
MLQDISIHSTARVETGQNRTRSRETSYFNPLHREGGDSESCTFLGSNQNFNPLHREGGDAEHMSLGTAGQQFQSTPPRGWRLWLSIRSGSGRYFNPLHREGGDFAELYFLYLFLDFNPLHREGGDLSKSYLYSIDTDFNPLHREGGDGARLCMDLEADEKFQSTPPRGWRHNTE